MRLSQNDMGRAFEYCVAIAFSERLPATLTKNRQLSTACQCFERCPNAEQQNMVNAAREVAAFLAAHDKRFSDIGCSLFLQSDQMGQTGDVRDIVIHNSKLNSDIGISAKNRHWAVKHSRLSEQIDFGYDWIGMHCSNNYFHTITPIFRELHTKQRLGELWRNIPDKKQRYYLPVLQAFQTEINSLLKKDNNVAMRIVLYLLGKYDYYKVIKENGEVAIISFNINGTLGWGSRMPLPKRMIEISPKSSSDTTLIMTFDSGWQISFRIHNASMMVEPSLKFDINIIGLPSATSRHVIPYNG